MSEQACESAMPDNSDMRLRARLRLRHFPDLDGMRLWLAHPGSGLSGLAEDLGGATPYWGFVWPGGLALAGHLFAWPERVKGRRVLDFGTGSGLAGIAAHLCGAASVTLCDSDPLARAASRLNAAENGLEPVDLAQEAFGAGDLVLAGDVFYAADAAAESLTRLSMLRAQGAEVLIGDPFRPDLPLARLAELARSQWRDVGVSDRAPAIATGIFTLADAAD